MGRISDFHSVEVELDDDNLTTRIGILRKPIEATKIEKSESPDV